MLHIPRWKIWLISGICLWGILGALPNVLPHHVTAQWPQWIPHQRVPLGLDLKGGLHLLLEVDIKTVVEDRVFTACESIRSVLKKNKIPFARLDTLEGRWVHVRLKDASYGPETLKILTQEEPDFESTWDAKEHVIRLALRNGALAHLKKASVDQSIEILRRRVDVSGTLEPVIVRQGDYRIVLQLPGMTDANHVKAMLGRTAKLSLRWVESDLIPSSQRPPSPPPGAEFLPIQERTSRDTSESPEIVGYYAVSKRPILIGDMLKDAQVGYDQNNQPEVMFQFNTAGARRFRDATTENVGRILAFVLDQEIISAPVIREPIPGGRGVINGRFTVQEASDLSLLLRAGALPAPLSIIEERSIGPDLGSDSIRYGAIATAAAIMAVCTLMVVVYSGFGMVANIAVFFNIVLLLAGMTLIQATLTLPGIAGIALTIGMAVDANVLIYERMKEEIRKKTSVSATIDAGYRRAMATIIDSNVTTLFGTTLLYVFGSGPIRGFAVTLTMGILISMFTSISLTRVIIVMWLRRRRRTSIPIGAV